VYKEGDGYSKGEDSLKKTNFEVEQNIALGITMTQGAALEFAALEFHYSNVFGPHSGQEHSQTRSLQIKSKTA
jgi:hypothetical protein